MNSKVLVIFILAVCLPHTAFCFSPPDSTRELYVESYPDRFYLKPLYNIRDVNLVIRSRNSGNRIRYNPNGNSYFGLGIYIFNIVVEGSLKIPQNEDNISTYGETEIFDFQMFLYAQKWGADIAIQNYNGFYARNPVDHFPNWSVGSPFPQRPDLSVDQVSMNAFYVFNHKKFSYRSAYNQADRQRKSGGSPLLGIKILNQHVYADTSLIPGHSQQDFGIRDFHSSKITALGLLPGYTYSFIYQYFYLNFSLSAGPAYLWSNYHEDEESYRKNQISPLINFSAALGYNNPRWFAGLTYIRQQSNLLTPHLDVNVESGNIKLFIGYRFKEVGFLKKDVFEILNNVRDAFR